MKWTRSAKTCPWLRARTKWLLAACLTVPGALAQLPSSTQTAVDNAVRKVLAETGGPGVSIAIVVDGKLAYEQAYGDARLEPKTQAQPGMRFKIASNSKQIAAAAILLLAEEGKLTLDDRVSRFLPNLRRSGEVTIRQLLSHTSGYQDFYPLDYVTPEMAKGTTPEAILNTWAKKPLDFEPGTKWQYSNTNYTIAGLIIEKITGKPLVEFLRQRIFGPLGMRSPIDVDRESWSGEDPLGYTQYALGPPRPVAPEGRGWMYAAGELAMTAHDLALWDISLMDGRVLKPASMAALTMEVKLKNGAGTGYGLGLQINSPEGHRKWSHTGGASGFLSSNFTRPDDRIAVTVLTNGETMAYRVIAQRIEDLLMAKRDDQASASLERVREIFRGLQHGSLDRSLLTADANSYFTEQAITDFANSLKSLGEPEFRQTRMEERGGMIERTFEIKAAGKSLNLSTYFTQEGKVAQYLIRLQP